MQLDVGFAVAGSRLCIELTIEPQGVWEKQLLLRHCSPHRRVNAVVPWEEMA